MELIDLIGVHQLSGVEYNNVAIQPYEDSRFEDAQVINFVLDDITYTVTEDPSDGYRSSMGSILASDFPVRNRFAPIQVVCSMRPNGEYYENEILDIYDAINHKLVLSVGTNHSDDYYPSFVSDFNPANMHVNEGK